MVSKNSSRTHNRIKKGNDTVLVKLVGCAIIRVPRSRWRAEANLADFDLSSGFDELLSGLAEISSTTAGSVAEDQITALEIGEMRNCAVLFADIKGFTALSEKLRAEEVKLIIDHTFKILTQEIKRFNGLVDKYIGDCVMAVFGSEVSGENDSEMAVRAGLAMLDRIRQINTLMKAKGIELGMRIGVNYGEVVYGTVGEGREKDTTVMGDTVNTAQRMESNAPVNSLLITGGTRKYLGEIFIYEEKEPILVKNKVEPVPVAIVTGVNHAIRERWHRTYVTGRTKFVGRGDEMNALLSAVKDAKSGEGACKAFIIEGPPGIGKSRLVYELRRRLRDDFGQEKTVLTSANPSYGTRAFFSIIDALRQYFEISEADSQEEAKDKFEAGFERLAAGMKEPERIKNALPIVGSMYGFGYEDERLKLDAASLEAERRIAIKTLFEAIAEKCAEDYGFPLVMIVDDIQWSDDGSHSALMLIAREVKAKMPVVIVQLCRSDFDLPEEIASFDGLSRIELGPLSSHQFREIIESMLPGLNVPKRLLSQILERSQGNPFFLEEIVSLFIDRGIFKADDDVWRIAAKIEHLAIPASVNSIILARIDRLDRELKELLQKASVAGMEVPFPVLDFVLKRTTHGYGGGETANLLSALMGRQMLFKSGKGGETEKETVYVFKNALIQEVAYGTLLRTNRRILHKITAEAIETGFADRLDGYLHILGMHFENAEDFAKAADYFERAGKNFAGLSRFAEAKKMFSSALASLARMHESESRTEKEIGITLALLDCCNSLGLYREGKEAAEKLFHTIEKHGVKSDLARIHRVLGVFAANLGEIETGLEHQDKARELFEELGDEQSLGRILLTLGLIAFRRSDWSEAEKRLTEALDASRKVGDRVLEESVYLSTGRLKMNLGRLPGAEAAYKTALEIAEEIGDRLAKARAISNIGIIAAMQGKYAEARECYTGGLEITREIGSQAEEANLLLNLGLVCFEQGELDAALDYGREAHAMYREMGSGEMEGIALGNMGLAYEHTGDINNAIECARASLELARAAQNEPEIGLRETYAAKYDVLAGDAGRLGELKDALERLESIGIAEYSAEGRLNYAQALASTEQYHEAETVLKSVIAMGGEGALAGIERIARRILDSMGEK